MEATVIIKCRKSDLELVKEILKEVSDTYAKRLSEEIPKLKGKTIKCNITVSEKDFLPELNSKESGLASCLGGIELMAYKNRIICNNTLDARLDLCYQSALPEIREILFGN